MNHSLVSVVIHLSAIHGVEKGEEKERSEQVCLRKQINKSKKLMAERGQTKEEGEKMIYLIPQKKE